MSRNGVKSIEQAKEKAAEYISSKDKLARLLSKAIGKARQNYELFLAPWESFQILLRMVRAWLGGEYSPPFLTVLAGVAALIYFVEPFDLIPDSVPVLGLLDDAGVVATVARANLNEISRFRRWEISSSCHKIVQLITR
ncbi:MAG TPA: YkvA family protein [Candidatus Acidoferrum sp.]|nr:YkvA family protein [Candidatus Acidoferrum sp.]